MKVFRSVTIIAAIAALALTSCHTDSKKATNPPKQANAPTLKPQAAQSQTNSAAQSPTTAKTGPAQTPAPSIDPVNDLIARAEAQFQAGQANYKAGHLDQAKIAFDRAFDILLSYPQGVRSDDRLEDEFDKVVDAVHDLEMVALKQGDGFTARSAEPAPIDEANQATFAIDPNIKAQAEAEVRNTKSDLPLVLNDYVASYINYFSHGGRGFLERALVRAGKYEPMIRRIFKEEGVPQDLIYLAEAESGFQPLALSRAGARGMWQFMAGRGAGYGLDRNWWIDERQDPEMSTRAAARHLKDLYKQFGDWYLAMAAYNSGPGNVQQAVQRTGYADFWELYKRNVLPAETKNYVPIILAVTLMAKNPAQYGLDHLQPDSPLNYDTVKVDYPVDLRLVAECVDSTVSNIQDLNPALLRMTTPKEGTYELKLPLGTAGKYQQAIAAIPRDMRVAWRYHKVTSGETLGEIARQYHTTSAAIAQVNNLNGNDPLPADARLIIPATPHRVSDGEQLITYSRHPISYKVRRGDTVVSVADDFSVPVSRLRRWNHLRGNELRVGRTLLVYRPLSAREQTSETRLASSKSQHKSDLHHSTKSHVRIVHHKVKAGETLSSIADDYNTTVAALRRDNGKSAARLRTGDVLVIHATE